MSMRPATLAFVDDHPVLLSGMCQLFSALDGFNVVAVGKSAQDAVEIFHSHEPDVIVVDLNMPGRTLEAIAKVASGGCLIPRFDGAILSQEWKEALWDKFVTGAPRPRTPSELQYSDRKLRSRS